MDAHYEIDVDPAGHLVRTTLRGFFTPAMLDAFLTARADAFTRLRCPVNQHLAITDVRDMKIQSQEMVAAFAGVLADPNSQARRLAFVVATSLARQQLRRAIGRRNARCFADMVEAETWLVADEAGQQAAS